jgi:hypothetical protein
VFLLLFTVQGLLSGRMVALGWRWW